MAEQAKVTSVEALEYFRSNLILFLTTAHQSVDEVGDAVRRTRQWVQQEQRMHWEGELRKRRRVLEQAEQELFSAKLAEHKHTMAAREAAVSKGKRAVGEAEEKLRNVKGWNRKFDGLADPLMKRLEGLRHFLDYEMPKALSYLVQTQRTLDAYAETARPEAPKAEQIPPTP